MMIWLLLGILLILSIAVGGIRGAKSFGVLIYNIMMLFVAILLLAHGFNAFLIMFVSSVAFTLLTVIYQIGFSIKSLTVVASVIATLIIMSLIIWYISFNSHISGLNEIQVEEGNNYMYYAVNIDMLSILIVGTVLSVLGAIIDTSVSISSAMNEIYVNNTLIKINKLFKSGISIGRDILGTTINTLLFVGFGESLMLLIYYAENNYTLLEIINLKSFFQEISIILISCIACALIIPITAFFFCASIRYKASLNHNSKLS